MIMIMMIMMTMMMMMAMNRGIRKDGMSKLARTQSIRGGCTPFHQLATRHHKCRGINNQILVMRLSKINLRHIRFNSDSNVEKGRAKGASRTCS